MATLLSDRPCPTEQRDPPISTGARALTRALHVINGEHYAGAERVQDLLAGELPRFGFEVGLACVKPGQFPGARAYRGAALYEVPMRHRFDLRVVGQLAGIVRRHGYQLLHAHSPRTLLAAAPVALMTGIPLVYHVHSPSLRDSTHRWRNRVNAAAERLSLTTASAVVTVSQALEEQVRRLGIPRRMTRVVRNGVPCRQPRPPRLVEEQEWTLGSVALYRPRKGMEVLLEALARLRSRGLPVRLRAVGGFESRQYERQLKSLTEKLDLAGVVRWTGFARDVDRELARLDLLVLPSLFGEGLPMVVLEAMAAGVPVVATRVEGIPEAIRDGRDGLLAEPGSPRSLARAISRVVGGEVEWSALRASALERHAERFSDWSMAAGVAAVYREVLNRRHRPGRAPAPGGQSIAIRRRRQTVESLCPR